MLHSLMLPRTDAVGQRLHQLNDGLLVQLDGHQWHTGVEACYAVSPSLQLDIDEAASPILWQQWRSHADTLPAIDCSKASTGPLPGWYGYLGYDAGRPLTRPSTGSLPVASIGFFPCIVVAWQHHLEIRFLAGYEQLASRIASTLEAECPAPSTFQLLSPFTTDTDEARYRQGFTRIIDYILAGDCYQVNFAQRFSAHFSGNAYAAHERIRRTMNSPYSSYVRHGAGSILSFSPEQFVSLCDGVIQTSPIKGTRPRETDPERDAQQRRQLLQSEKDRAENVMIVDLLRNDLSKVAELGSVTVPALFEIESFKHVHHMVSTVSARLHPQRDALDVLQACFPGGSITGAPKRRACEIIAEVEAYPRSAYCGSVFYVDIAGNMQSNILIRTVVAETDTLYCWGGGGIVADSDCRQEYEETLHKVGRLMTLFEE